MNGGQIILIKGVLPDVFEVGSKKYVKLMMYVKSDFLMLVQQCVIIDVRPTLF